MSWERAGNRERGKRNKLKRRRGEKEGGKD